MILSWGSVFLTCAHSEITDILPTVNKINLPKPRVDHGLEKCLFFSPSTSIRMERTGLTSSIFSSRIVHWEDSLLTRRDPSGQTVSDQINLWYLQTELIDPTSET